MVLSGIGILLSCVPAGLVAFMRLMGPKIGDPFSSINSSLPRQICAMIGSFDFGREPAPTT
jgi:hypothetical protein